MLIVSLVILLVVCASTPGDMGMCMHVGMHVSHKHTECLSDRLQMITLQARVTFDMGLQSKYCNEQVQTCDQVYTSVRK